MFLIMARNIKIVPVIEIQVSTTELDTTDSGYEWPTIKVQPIFRHVKGGAKGLHKKRFNGDISTK
jgi:hypothetical protein